MAAIARTIFAKESGRHQRVGYEGEAAEAFDELTEEVQLVRPQVNRMAEPHTIVPAPPSGSLDLIRPLQASGTAVVVQVGEITITLQGC